MSGSEKMSPSERAGIARDAAGMVESMLTTSAPGAVEADIRGKMAQAFAKPVTEIFTTTDAATGETGLPEVCWLNQSLDMRIVRRPFETIVLETLGSDSMGVPKWSHTLTVSRDAVSRNKAAEWLLDVCLSLPACPT